MDARHVGFGLGGRSGSSGSSERSRRNRPAVAVETLEGRALLSGVVAIVATLPAAVQAGPMVAASDNSLWFVENNGSLHTTIAKLNASGTKTETRLPSWLEPGTVAGVGADKAGDVWFSVQTPYQGSGGYNYRGKVGEITPDGTIHEFQFPSFDDIPGAAAIGPDGNFWVAFNNVQNGPGIARVVPNGNVTEFMVTGASSVNSLTSGPDGSLWFVDGNKIGKMSTQGTVAEFVIPASPGKSSVDLSNAQLSAGGDGNVWFINAGALNQITPLGNVKAVATPNGQLTSLSAAGNGNLWYSLIPAANGPLSDRPGPVVARLSSQGITTILPDRAGDSAVPVTAITPAPDGSIWFNEGNVTLARISSAVTLPILTQTTKPMSDTDPSQVFTGAIASFTSNLLNSKASDFTASIDWGDGHVSAGSVVPNVSGGFDVVGSNSFSAPINAIEKATIVVTGPNTTQAVINGSVQIIAPPPTNSGGTWTKFPTGPAPTPVVTTPVVVATPVVTTPVVVVTTPVVAPTPVVTTPVVVATPVFVATPVVTTPAPPTPASSPTTTTTTTTNPTTATTTPSSLATTSTTTGTAPNPNLTVNVSVNPTLNANNVASTPSAPATHWVRGPRGRWMLVQNGTTIRNIGAAHPKAPVHKPKPRHHY